MDDISAWRAAIGLFHGRNTLVHGKVLVQVSIPLLYVLFMLMMTCRHYITHFHLFLREFIENNDFKFILFLILLEANDIESNPGPNNEFHCLSILHCNIRSIRNKIDYIVDNFIDFDILSFTETHLDASIENSNLSLGDKFDEPYRKDRTNHGGGLLVYLDKNIIHNRIPELELFCNESIWIKIKKGTEILLVGLFYSPKTADAEFFNNFNKSLEKAYDISHNLLILGDLNEDLLNNNYHNLKDILYLNSLKNVIEVPTRGNAILDPIIVQTDFNFLDSGILSVPSQISDHNATFIVLPFSYSIEHTFERKIWLYDKANFESLNNKIELFDWNKLLNCTMNEACELFTNTFINFVKECIPSKTIIVRPNDKPWFDSKIRKFCRLRDRYKSNAVKSGKKNDWDKYKKTRNKVNNLKKYAKNHFFNNLELTLNDLQSNDKRSFWKVIRHFVKGDISSNIPPLSDLNNDSFHITTQNKAEC